MRSISGSLAVSLAACLLLLAACGGGGGQRRGGGRAPGARPQDTLLSLIVTQKQNDKDAFLALHYAGSDLEIEALKASFDLNQVGWAFEKALTEEYGPDAWGTFHPLPAWRDGVLPADDSRWVERVLLRKEDEETYSARLPNVDDRINLKLRNGVWRIHIASLFPPGVGARRSKDLCEKVRKALKKVEPKIGEGGMTVAKLKTEFVREYNRTQ